MTHPSRRQFVGTLASLAACWRAAAADSSKRFVAYSMNQAFQRLERARGSTQDFRRNDPSLYYLGGITKPWAVVVDEGNQDWILVGERDPMSSVVTLDDWVVALRARFVHGSRDPGVTIDPRGEAEGATRQDVRFFGGVENTRFGRVCYDADWLMKKIGMRLETLPVEGLKTYFDLAVEEANRSGGGGQVASRFWFYPALNRVNVVDNVVLLERFQMGVFTEILAARVNGVEVTNLADFHHGPSQGFARSFESNYDAIAASREVIETLRGLTRLAGLAAGLRSVVPVRNLSYWLAGYVPAMVETPLEVEVLHQAAEEVGLRISGGVSLAALATRLAGGDASAFRGLVKASRGKDELVWEFAVNLRDGRPENVSIPDRLADPRMILPLWTQALFLYEKRRYEAARTLVSSVIEQTPEWEYAYVVRGAAWGGEGSYERALEDFSKAISLNPRLAEAHFNRGNARAKLLRVREAIEDYDRALEINPAFVEAYLNRGVALEEQGQWQRALADYEKALEIQPKAAQAWFLRGVLSFQRGKHDNALKDLDEALKCDPHLARVYLSKAEMLESLGRRQEAVECYSRFLQYDQPVEGSPRDWKEYARARAQELLKEMAMPPAYERSHGGVPVAERLRRIRSRLALNPKGKRGGTP